MVEDALVGRAKLWYEARTFPFISYAHFKEKFLDEFYSIEARMVAKSQWENRRFKDSDASLQGYYIEQIRDAKFCLTSLQEYEINYLIIKQLPQRAREVLATIDYLNTAKIIQTLARLDVTRGEADIGMPAKSRNNFSGNSNQSKMQFEQARRINDQNDTSHVEKGSNVQSGKFNNNDANRYRNWRQRPTQDSQYHRDKTIEGSQISERGRADDSQQGSNVRVLNKSKMSEFVEELCWDVEPSEKTNISNLELKIVSPRIRVKIGEIEIPILVDSGSEVTVISEVFYNQLKVNSRVVELPVNNVTVNVAVGNKSTVIKRQVQLLLEIDGETLEFPFLVVPGLSTEVLVGIDWMSRYKCVIDVANQRIRLGEKDLSDKVVTFRMAREVKAACRFIRTQGILWYDINGSQGRLGNGMKKEEARLCDFEDLSEEVQDINKNSNEVKNMMYISERESEFVIEVNECVSKISTIDKDQKERVKVLLLKYKNIFSKTPGCTGVYSHSISLKNDRSIVRKSYPVALTQRAGVRLALDQMETMDIIRRSNSRHCNPLRIVVKKNGEIRVCLDARFLNDKIQSDNECPPLMEELLQEFEGVKFLSTTDMNSGYWQIPLDEESKQYTAFLFEGHLYEFNRIPFGLKTAGSGFIRALSIALGQELEEFVSCYVDDILIASGTFEEHLEHLERLFMKLEMSGFTLSLAKSRFFREEVSFLGFKLSADGIRADPDRLSVIADFPCPNDKRQLQAFLGVCGYYRRFSVKHSKFIGPFRDLLSGGGKWCWTEEHSRASQNLKDNFMRAVTLSHYLPNKKFKLQTDASDIGISGILYQIDDEGDNRIISLASRVLTQCESRYTTSEKELLAIIYCLVKFSMYLLGSKFEIITDHQALTFLLSTPYHNARLMRWILSMQEFNFDIIHCKGSDNLVADFFSRNFGHETSIDNRNQFLIGRLMIDSLERRSRGKSADHEQIPSIDFNDEIISELNNLGTMHRADEGIQRLIVKESLDLNFREFRGITYIKGIRDDNWKVAMPRCLVGKILRAVHEQLGHVGSYKMYRYLSGMFHWRYMRRDIKNYARGCDRCQRTKCVNYKTEGIYQFIKASNVNEIIAVDFYGPLPMSVAGVTYIFVVQDLFSKLVSFYPIKRANTKICLKKLINDYFTRVGKPIRVLSDHGTQFTSPLWKTSLAAEGVKAIFSSIRHPQSNPVERTMRELGRFFRTLCSERHTSWAKYVPMIQNCLNVVSHHSTGLVPYTLHFGRSPRDRILDLFPILKERKNCHDFYVQLAQKNLQKSYEQRLKNQGKTSRIKFEKNDLVLLRVPHLSDASQRVTHKFFHLYEGPFRVIDTLNENAYVLVDPENELKVKGTYNRFHLRKYYQVTKD